MKSQAMAKTIAVYVLVLLAANVLVFIGLMLQAMAAIIHLLGEWIENFGNRLTDWD
jgi:hypothetical protein